MRIGREDKRLVAVTHLAWARSQKTRRGILGSIMYAGLLHARTKDKKQLFGKPEAAFLWIAIMEGGGRNLEKEARAGKGDDLRHDDFRLLGIGSQRCS